MARALDQAQGALARGSAANALRKRRTGTRLSPVLPRFARGLLFLQHIFGLFVRAQAEEGWMAHLTGAGPLREFHLAHQLRLDPCGGSLVLDALLERRTACPER